MVKVCLRCLSSVHVLKERCVVMDSSAAELLVVDHHVWETRLALSAEIFRANLRAGHMHAIFQWVHLRPTQINGMDQLMYHGFVSMGLIAQMLLTKKNLWQKSQTNLAIIGSVELLSQILVRAVALRRLGSLCNGIRKRGVGQA